jgi:hypothetical protein
MSMTLTAGPHQIAPYGFWCHTDNATGKKLIFLNATSNNFLKRTNYNYSYNLLNRPVKSMVDFAMSKIRTINGIPNIPSFSTIITLKTSDIILVTSFCTVIKLINNTKSSTMGINSLSKS